MAYRDVWPVSQWWTLVIAPIAGVGAVALYYGNDPAAPTRGETTR